MPTLSGPERGLSSFSPEVAGVRSAPKTPEAHAPPCDTRGQVINTHKLICACTDRRKLAPVLAEPALRVHGGHRARARRRDRLAVDGIRHIPSGVDAGYTGHGRSW